MLYSYKYDKNENGEKIGKQLTENQSTTDKVSLFWMFSDRISTLI